MAYDRQLIIQVLTGHGDSSIKQGSTSLNAAVKLKNLKSDIVTYPAHAGRISLSWRVSQLRKALAKLTAQSRVYIRGHGDWINATSGGVSGKDMADKLNELGMPRVKLISITSCEGARGAAFRSNLIAYGNESFAGKFHDRLHDHGIDTVVYARVYSVFVTSAKHAKKYTGEVLGHKKTLDDFEADDEMGQTAGDDVFQHQRSESKMKFEWTGGQQVRSWAY